MNSYHAFVAVMVAVILPLSSTDAQARIIGWQVPDAIRDQDQPDWSQITYYEDGSRDPTVEQQLASDACRNTEDDKDCVIAGVVRNEVDQVVVNTWKDVVTRVGYDPNKVTREIIETALALRLIEFAGHSQNFDTALLSSFQAQQSAFPTQTTIADYVEVMASKGVTPDRYINAGRLYVPEGDPALPVAQQAMRTYVSLVPIVGGAGLSVTAITVGAAGALAAGGAAAVALSSSGGGGNGGPLPPETVPDLVIRDIDLETLTVSCPSGAGSCVTTVDIIMENVDRGAAGSFQTQAIFDPAQSVEVIAEMPSGLAPNTQLTVQFETEPGGNCFDPNCLICATIDFRDNVLETNESNNTLCRELGG